MIDTSKVIHAPVGGGRYTVTAPIVKEDYGLYLKIEGLELPSTYEVDFSNSEHNGTSVTMIGNSDGVLIPHQFIDSGKDVFAFLYHVGDNYGRTVFKFRIPNKLRPDRTEETPTPTQQSVIDQAISALNSAVEQTAQDVIDADASAQSASESAEQAESAKGVAQNYAQDAQTSATYASQSESNAQASAAASANSASQSAQIKTDVEDLVDDAQGYAESASQSASASAQSASDAQGYAQSASASAQSASGYASSAQTSAQTASSKAQDASTSAQTASQKATEASQSATTASNKASEASGYATSASQAKTDAESARDSAQGYASDAQGYANDAQASAESISASASQIAQNTADILKAFPTDTASGAVASFSDGADGIPLKSLIVNIDPVQDTSSGDPSPENICPISGWTGMTVNAAGKNIVDISRFATEYPNYCAFSNGVLTVTSNSALYSKGINVDIPQGSVLNWTITNGTSVNARLRIVYEDGTVRSHSSPIPLTVSKRITALRFDWGTGGTFTVSNFQAEFGTTATAYEPYQGQTIPISWQTEAGTVYGGKLDVLSGELTVDRLGLDGGDLSWAKVDSYNYGNFYVLPTPLASYVSTRPTVISSSYKSESNQSASSTNDCYVWIRSVSASNRRIYVKDTSKASMTAEEFRTAMTGVQFVYELAEPIEIQLTTHEVNSLLGVNNIWADTGDTSAEYRADIKLYIEKLTQPEEDDMVADSAITSGQFFMVGNTLYRALANIASGAIITVGTNAQRVSLADALNLVNA